MLFVNLPSFLKGIFLLDREINIISRQEIFDEEWRAEVCPPNEMLLKLRLVEVTKYLQQRLGHGS